MITPADPDTPTTAVTVAMLRQFFAWVIDLDRILTSVSAWTQEHQVADPRLDERIAKVHPFSVIASAYLADVTDGLRVVGSQNFTDLKEYLPSMRASSY